MTSKRHSHPRLTALALLGLLLILLLLPARVALADTIIRDGETVTTDVTVAEDFRLDAGGVVNASVYIWGGDAVVAGQIDGDLLVLGGDLELEDTAVITGDCVVLGGELKADADQISCQTTNDMGIALPNFARDFAPFGGKLFSGSDGPIAPIAPIPPNGPEPAFDGESSRGGSLFGAIGSSLLLGLLALLVVAIAPRQVTRVSDAIASKPVASGTVGVLTLLASVSTAVLLAVISAVLVIVCIGLLGIPVVLAIVALLGIGLLVGWVAVGSIVGSALTDAMRLRTVRPAVKAALGTAALSLGLGLLQLLPVVGFSAGLINFAVFAIGLGGVALTKFGTRPFPRVIDAGVRPDKLTIVLDTLPNDNVL